MRISYNWLKEFIDIKVNPQKLADDLSLFGHEIESITKIDDDYILDFEITPNRGDLLSIYGIAREVAALYKLKIKNLKFKISESIINKKIKIKFFDYSICPRFTARIIDNIEIKSSPKWMQERLKSIGIRPINNIVDITNYVMIETGQPLHAFDYNKIYKGQMQIRLAKEGESIVTLDGIKRNLNKNEIIIEDDQKIYDLAGIMGGKNSEVDANTKTIILQGAIFDRIFIRRTSKQLKITTEASYRYERGVDAEGTISGINKASEMIQEISKKSIIGDLVDIKSQIESISKIEFTPFQINKLLGTNLDINKIEKYLNDLGFKIGYKTTNKSDIVKDVAIIPSYRKHDVVLWRDIAEEVARMYGYSNLGKKLPEKTIQKENIEFIRKEYIKDLLVKNSFVEIYSYSFANQKLLQILDVDLTKCRKVINSVAPELIYLRPDLRSCILETISKNPWAPDVKIFEIGKVFTENSEKWQLGFATTGKSDLDLKNILSLFKIRSEIVSVNKKILDFLKIRRQVKYVIININNINIDSKMYIQELSKNKYKTVSEFPPTIRDLAFIVENNIDSENVRKYISEINDHILIVEMFDEFNSDKFGKNKKNIAYHIWLQDLKGPMNEKLTNKIIDKIINEIKNKFNAKLRG